MVMICELKPNILSFKDNEIINNKVCTKYLSFNDILSSVYDYIGKYVRDIKLGLQMHSLFELIDFSNPDYSGIDEFKKRKLGFIACFF